MPVRRLPALLVASLAVLAAGCGSAPPLDTTPASQKTASALLGHGVTLYNEYDFDKAEKLFKQALLEYRRSDNPEGIARSCLNLARISQAKNRPELRDAYLEKAAVQINRHSLDALRAHLAIQQSSAAIEQQAYQQAIDILAPYLPTAPARPGDQPAEAQALTLAALKNRVRIAFLQQSDDRADWLARYKQAIKDNNSNHAARALRFEAALSADNATLKLQQALAIYRQHGNQPGIAATLAQWAGVDIAQNRLDSASDKLHRALYIRQHLRDSRRCLTLLQSLQAIYRDTGDPRLATVEQWIATLERGDFIAWSVFINDFDRYPH